MTVILWIVLALLVAGAIIFMSSLQTRRSLPTLELPDGEALPKTVLQRRAGWTLLVAVLLVATAAGCLVLVGPETWWEDDAIRHLVTVLLLGVLAVYLAFMVGVRSLATRDDGSFDERDELILASVTRYAGCASSTAK